MFSSFLQWFCLDEISFLTLMLCLSEWWCVKLQGVSCSLCLSLDPRTAAASNRTKRSSPVNSISSTTAVYLTARCKNRFGLTVVNSFLCSMYTVQTEHTANLLPRHFELTFIITSMLRFMVKRIKLAYLHTIFVNKTRILINLILTRKVYAC